MIPTVPFNLLCGVVLGLLFSYAARTQFRDGRTPWGRELRAVASFQILIRWPVAIYFFLAHREWSALYLSGAEHLGPALLVLVLPLDAAALAGGYLGGWKIIRKHGEVALQAACVGSALGLVLFVVLLRERLFRDDEGRLPWLLVAVTLGVGAAAAAVYRTLVSESRRKGPIDQEPLRRRQP